MHMNPNKAVRHSVVTFEQGAGYARVVGWLRVERVFLPLLVSGEDKLAIFTKAADLNVTDVYTESQIGAVCLAHIRKQCSSAQHPATGHHNAEVRGKAVTQARIEINVAILALAAKPCFKKAMQVDDFP